MSKPLKKKRFLSFAIQPDVSSSRGSGSLPMAQTVKILQNCKLLFRPVSITVPLKKNCTKVWLLFFPTGRDVWTWCLSRLGRNTTGSRVSLMEVRLLHLHCQHLDRHKPSKWASLEAIPLKRTAVHSRSRADMLNGGNRAVMFLKQWAFSFSCRVYAFLS